MEEEQRRIVKISLIVELYIPGYRDTAFFKLVSNIFIIIGFLNSTVFQMCTLIFNMLILKIK